MEFEREMFDLGGLLGRGGSTLVVEAWWMYCRYLELMASFGSLIQLENDG